MIAIDEHECEVSKMDAGYRNFKGKDLTQCIMVKNSFFGAELRGAN